MADKERYVIKIQGDLIEVSKDVYYAYFRMERQERTQEEKQKRNAVVSYDALDGDGVVGAECIADITTPSMEEMMIAKELHEKLNRAIATLPRAERELIKAIYFDELTEEKYAKRNGMSQTGVNYRHGKILSKLKMFLNVLGSFD